MTQRVKIQDGNILYSAADSVDSVNFGIAGQLNVTKEINVGDDPLADGIITTPPGADLIVETGAGGNLRLTPSGSIILGNTSWPDGTVTAVPGMFVGVASVNNLQFKSFIVGNAPTDNETNAQLNILFPTATPGQFAVAPASIYQSLGSGNWRKLGGADDSTVPYYIPTGDTYLVRQNKQALYHLPIEVDGNLEIDGFLIEV